MYLIYNVDQIHQLLNKCELYIIKRIGRSIILINNNNKKKKAYKIILTLDLQFILHQTPFLLITQQPSSHFPFSFHFLPIFILRSHNSHYSLQKTLIFSSNFQSLPLQFSHQSFVCVNSIFSVNFYF
jgi:hypothetical protein